MFLITPLIVYIIHKNLAKGILITIFLILFSSVWGIYLSLEYHFRFTIPNFSAPKGFLNEYYNRFYYMPWSRMNVYFLGVIFATAYKSFKTQ